MRPYLLPLFLSIYRKVDSKEATERKKAVQEMNEGELLTALREKLKNIEAAGEIESALPFSDLDELYFPGSSDSESDFDDFDDE